MARGVKIEQGSSGIIRFGELDASGVNLTEDCRLNSNSAHNVRFQDNGGGNNVHFYVGGSVHFQGSDGTVHASKVYNAVWNDIVDFIEADLDGKPIEYGKAYIYDQASEKHKPAEYYGDTRVIGIPSDVYGIGVGEKKPEVTTLPISIAGFILAHVEAPYETGTPLVATEGGILIKATKDIIKNRNHAIIALYYKRESNETWNGIEVKGRHWVKVL
jgi:hypothetical protein